MPTVHPPSDLEEVICLSDLSPDTRARVNASRRPPMNPPVPASDIQSFDELHGRGPGHDVPGTEPQRIPSESQLMPPQIVQTQQDYAPIHREDTLGFPFQPPRPSFPRMRAAPTLSPTTASTPTITPTITPSLTPSLPVVQLPAMGAPRPLPSERSVSMAPPTVQKRKMGSKSTNVKKRKKGAQGQAVEIEESDQDTDEQAGDELTTLIQVLKSDITVFRVDLPAPFIVTAGGEAQGDLGLAIRSLGQYVTDQVNLVRGGLLLLATRVSALEGQVKTSRKPPKGERSDQENEVIKYIKSEVHLGVQGILHWNPSDGIEALPCEGDKYTDDESGEESKINTPQWDERINSVPNVTWVNTVITLIEQNIKRNMEGNEILKESLQGIVINKHIEDILKGYIRHLKTSWARAKLDPSRMKRERRHVRRFGRQREESFRTLRVLDRLNVVVANSVNQLGITEIIAIKEHHLPPDIFSEDESGPEDDTPEAIQAFLGYANSFQVGEFYLTHSKPYLSPAVTDLKTLARTIYKSIHVGQTAKKRIKGPASKLPPPDLKLEGWMVDLKWVLERGLATPTFLKNSVPGDQIGEIMKNALYTWNKESRASAIEHDQGEDNSPGSGSNPCRVVGNSADESVI